MLRILILGEGGREHALTWRLAASASVENIFVMPGNSGTECMKPKVRNVPKIDLKVVEDIFPFLKYNDINFVIPTREGDLTSGIVDRLSSVGVRCFGPTKAAALLEGSKHFAKMFMAHHGIVTPAHRSFWTFEDAVEYLTDHPTSPMVIKASGLTCGKGVIIVRSVVEAQKALLRFFKEEAFGSITECGPVLIEEYVEGPEFSVMAITDGSCTKTFPPFRDFKRRFEGNTGPNTGGMGCQAPAQECSSALLETIQTDIVQPTIMGMESEGRRYSGLLCVDIVLTDQGPVVLEYDVRPGDPETQA